LQFVSSESNAITKDSSLQFVSGGSNAITKDSPLQFVSGGSKARHRPMQPAVTLTRVVQFQCVLVCVWCGVCVCVCVCHSRNCKPALIEISLSPKDELSSTVKCTEQHCHMH
jgi:hypothetical protein